MRYLNTGYGVILKTVPQMKMMAVIIITLSLTTLRLSNFQKTLRVLKNLSL